MTSFDADEWVDRWSAHWVNRVFAIVAAVGAVLSIVLERGWLKWVFLLIAIGLIFWLLRGREQAMTALRRTRFAVDEMSIHRPAFDESQTIKYTVGEKSSGDYEVQTFRTTAVEAVGYRAIGITPSAKGRRASQLGLKVALLSTSGERTIEPVVLREGDELRLLVVFLPAIPPGETVEWKVELGWPGTWDPLRKDGQDSIQRGQALDGQISSTIKIEGPNGRALAWAQRPGVGTCSVDQDAGRTVLTWTASAVPKHTYSWTLRMK